MKKHKKGADVRTGKSKGNKPSTVTNSEKDNSERRLTHTGDEKNVKQIEATEVARVATSDDEEDVRLVTNNTLTSLPGAFRVGEDSVEDEATVTTLSSRRVLPPAAVAERGASSAALPIAAEVATDLEAVVAERELLKKELKELKEERQQENVVQADAVPVEEKKKLGITNAPGKLRDATNTNIFSIRRPKHVVAGVSSGTKNIFRGAFAGMACLLTEPLAGAQDEGVKGFAKGCVTGVGKSVALPIGGLFVGCYQVGRGVVNTFPYSVNALRKNKRLEENQTVSN